MGVIEYPGTGDLEWLTNTTMGEWVLWRSYRCWQKE